MAYAREELLGKGKKLWGRLVSSAGEKEKFGVEGLACFRHRRVKLMLSSRYAETYKKFFAGRLLGGIREKRRRCAAAMHRHTHMPYG